MEDYYAGGDRFDPENSPSHLTPLHGNSRPVSVEQEQDPEVRDISPFMSDEKGEASLAVARIAPSW